MAWRQVWPEFSFKRSERVTRVLLKSWTLIYRAMTIKKGCFCMTRFTMLPFHLKNDLKVDTLLFSTGCFWCFKLIIVNNIHHSHLAQAGTNCVPFIYSSFTFIVSSKHELPAVLLAVGIPHLAALWELTAQMLLSWWRCFLKVITVSVWMRFVDLRRVLWNGFHSFKQMRRNICGFETSLLCVTFISKLLCVTGGLGVCCVTGRCT